MYTSAEACLVYTVSVLGPPLRIDVLKRRLHLTDVPADILAKVVKDDQLYFDVLNAGAMAGTGLDDQTAADKGFVKNHWMARVLMGRCRRGRPDRLRLQRRAPSQHRLRRWPVRPEQSWRLRIRLRRQSGR
jgi:hypothetical protein